MEKIYKMRVTATKEKDDTKQNTAKLFGKFINNKIIEFQFIILGNSGYGKFIENPRNYSTTKIHNEKQLQRAMRKSTYNTSVDLINECGITGLHESSMNKKLIKEDKPIQIGQAILQYSKLHFLRFVKFLDDFLQEDSFKFCYADTDSICIGNIISIFNIKFNCYFSCYED